MHELEDIGAQLKQFFFTSHNIVEFVILALGSTQVTSKFC